MSIPNNLTRDSLMQEIDASWQELQTFLASLTPHQMTEPTDAAGWTVKDHIIHIAMWEKAALALLEGQSKRESLDIPQDIWDQDDDPINAVLQERYHTMPLSDVMQTLERHHTLILSKLARMTEADLQRPHKEYQPTSDQDSPIIRWVFWDTVEHYRDHIPWIAAIAANA